MLRAMSASTLSIVTPVPPAGPGLVRLALLVATAALLAGCQVLPTIAPDLAPASRRQGIGRTLSTDDTKNLIAGLERRGVADDALQRHLAFEEAIAGHPLSVGNDAELLVDGPATLQAMLDAIASARQRIRFESYIFEAGETGERFAQALLERGAAGVDIALIVDSVGILGQPKAFFERLRDGGVRVLEFNPVNPLAAKAGWSVNDRDHRKLLVVDGRIAFVGGVNVSGVYSAGSSSSGSSKGLSGSADAPATGQEKDLPWRDTHLRLAGPVAADFERLFHDTWERQHGEPLPPPPAGTPARRGDALVRAIGSSPQDEHAAIYATLVSAIAHARREVLLSNAYFVPDEQFLQTLEDAARRGVKVRMVLPGHSDSTLVFHAGRSFYDRLLKVGVELHERHDALLHAKTAVIDGVWSTIGSTNLDWRSFLHNQEVNAVVLGPAFGGRMRALFEDDVRRSQAITLEAWRRRSLGDRLMETFSRAWAYWL